MKELSIEEKAKRYDEALDRANAVHKDEDRHLKATLERIFPELKDKDERIRKDIIWCLKHSGIKESNPINPHVTTIIKDAVAWLENQGEQKPVWSERDESNLDIAIYYIRREPYLESNVEPIVDWLRILKERVQQK